MSSEKRLEVIKAAYRLFSEKGYERTTIRDLCKATNLTAPSLYHYIKNKRNLLNLVEEYVFKDFETIFEAEKEGGNSRETMLRLFERFVDVILRNYGVLYILLETFVLQRGGDQDEEHEERQKKFVRRVKSVLERIAERGEVNPGVNITIAGFTIISMINWLPLWFDPARGMSGKEIALSMYTLFSEGFFK